MATVHEMTRQIVAIRRDQKTRHVELATLVSANGDRANIRLRNSASILRNVLVVGDGSDLVPGQKVQVSWEYRDGSAQRVPVVVTNAGVGGNYSQTIVNTGVVAGDFYTKTELQTSGQSSVHWGNITFKPSTFPPTPHNISHQLGGDDEIQLDNLGVPDDNTDLNATTTEHGLLPKLTGISGSVLTRDANAPIWSTYAIAAGGAYTLTIPATGTAALLEIRNIFTVQQTITGSADEAQLIVNGNSAQTSEVVQVVRNDNVSANISPTLRIAHNTTDGKGAGDGFGSSVTFYLESSTTPDREAGRVSAAWSTAADASRTARLSLWVTDTVGTYETFSLVNRSTARIWYDTTYYADLSVNNSGLLTISPVGDIVLAPGGYDVLPDVGYQVNLGMLTKKYLTLHCAELWVETLVAQNTVATIGGRILVGPTTTLTSDMKDVDTSMIVKHNQMMHGDTGYFEANGQVEFIAIVGLALAGVSTAVDYFCFSGDVTKKFTKGTKFYIYGTPSGANDGVWTANGTTSYAGGLSFIYVSEDIVSSSYSGGRVQWTAPTEDGPFTYDITRNLDGSGANNWTAGDACFNTGNTGDGFIDLYSISSVRPGGAEYGPTIVGNVRTSTSYNAWVEHWAIGNLNGVYGYSDNTYGVGLGKYSTTTSYLTADATNGIRMMRGTTVLAQWDIAGNILIGQQVANQNNVYISAGAISIRNNATERIEMTAAGIMTIKDSAGNAVLTFDAAQGAEITKTLAMKGASAAISIGNTPPASAVSGTGIWIDKTGMYGLKTNALQAKFDAVTGAIIAGGGNIVMDATGMHIAVDTSDLEESAVNFTYNGTLIGALASYADEISRNVVSIYAYSRSALNNRIRVLAYPGAGGGSDVWLDAQGTGASASVVLNGGPTEATTYITLTPGVRIEGGLWVGSLASAATAGYIIANGRVGAGTGTPGVQVDALGNIAIAGPGTNQIRAMDSTSAAIDVGGSIAMGGYYSGTTSAAVYGAVKGGKEIATAGNYASYLSFFTRANLANLTEKMRITSVGDVGIMTTTPSSYLAGCNGVVINDDAAAISFRAPTANNFWLFYRSGNELRSYYSGNGTGTVRSTFTAAGFIFYSYDTAQREVFRGSASGAGAPTIGFLGAAAIARPTVTGSKGGNAALTSLCTALANLGLIVNSTT